MSIEDRIHRLEKCFKTPEGTVISRVFAKDRGVEWSIGFGQMMTPKSFFIGSTISEALKKAEKEIL